MERFVWMSLDNVFRALNSQCHNMVFVPLLAGVAVGFVLASTRAGCAPFKSLYAVHHHLHCLPL
jgi:hypothetical protein